MAVTSDASESCFSFVEKAEAASVGDDFLRLVTNEIVQILQLGDDEIAVQIVHNLLENGRRSLVAYEKEMIPRIYREVMNGNENKLMFSLKKYFQQIWETQYGRSNQWFIAFLKQYENGENHDIYARVLTRTAEYGHKYMKDCPILSIVLRLLFENIDNDCLEATKVFDDLWFTVTNDGLKSIKDYSNYIIPSVMNTQLQSDSVLFRALREYYRPNVISSLRDSRIADKNNLYELALDDVTQNGWLIDMKHMKDEIRPKSYEKLLKNLESFYKKSKSSTNEQLNTTDIQSTEVVPQPEPTLPKINKTVTEEIGSPQKFDESDDSDDSESDIPNPKPFNNKKIFVSGLPLAIPEQSLCDKLGLVFSTVFDNKTDIQTKKLKIRLLKRKDNRSQAARNAAITFEEEELAIRAIKKYDEQQVPILNDARISVRLWKKSRKYPETPRKLRPKSELELIVRRDDPGKVKDLPYPNPPDNNRRPTGKVCIYWDIENVHIPRGLSASDIVLRLRTRLIEDRQLSEESFTVYANVNRIPEAHQQDFTKASVTMNHIQDIKHDSADQKILADLNKFKDNHKTPATVILLTGDIDFIYITYELRFRCNHYVIVVYNPQANRQLLQMANEAHQLNEFTTPPAPPRSPVSTPDMKPCKYKAKCRDWQCKRMHPNDRPLLCRSARACKDQSCRKLHPSERNKCILPKLETKIIELTGAQYDFLQSFGESILDRIRKEPGIERVHVLAGKLELCGRVPSIETMKTYLKSSLYEQNTEIEDTLADYLNLNTKGPLIKELLNERRVGISYHKIWNNVEMVNGKRVCERGDKAESDDDDKDVASNVKRAQNRVKVMLCSDSAEALLEVISKLNSYSLIKKSFPLTGEQVSFILKSQTVRRNCTQKDYIRRYFKDFVQSKTNFIVTIVISNRKGIWRVALKGFRDHVDNGVTAMKNFLNETVQIEQQIGISTPMAFYLRTKGRKNLEKLERKLNIKIESSSPRRRPDEAKSRDEEDDENSCLKISGSSLCVNNARNDIDTFLENLSEQEKHYPYPSWDVAINVGQRVRRRLINLSKSNDCFAIGWLKHYSMAKQRAIEPVLTLTVVGLNEDMTSDVLQQCEDVIGGFLSWTPSLDEFHAIFRVLIYNRSPSLEEFKQECGADIRLNSDTKSITIEAPTKIVAAETQTAMLTLADGKKVRVQRSSEFIPISMKIRRFVRAPMNSLIEEAKTQKGFFQSRTRDGLTIRGPSDLIIELKVRLNVIIQDIEKQLVERRFRLSSVESDFLCANKYKVATRIEEETNTVIYDTNTDSNDEKAASAKAIIQNIRGQAIIIDIGDITKATHVDAIVNAANGSLKHAGGVAKAIANAAGSALDQECKALIANNEDAPIPVGRAVKTTAGNLPFKCVIHAIAPRYKDGNQQERSLLFACVLSSLQLAESEGCTSIALPAIGSKIYRFPLADSVNVIVRAVKQFFADYPQSNLRNVVLLDVDEDVVTAFVHETLVDHRNSLLNNDDNMTISEPASLTVKWGWQDNSDEKMHNDDNTREIENAFQEFLKPEVSNKSDNATEGSGSFLSKFWDLLSNTDSKYSIKPVKLRDDDSKSATLIDYELYFDLELKKSATTNPVVLEKRLVVGYQFRKDTKEKCEIIRDPIQQQERLIPVVLNRNPLDFFGSTPEIDGSEWNLIGISHQSVRDAEQEIHRAIQSAKVSESISVNVDRALDEHKFKIIAIGIQQRIQIEFQFQSENDRQLTMVLTGLKGNVAEAKYQILVYAQNVVRTQIDNDEDLQWPKEWTDQQEECRLVEIERNDPNFTRIEIRMKETMSNVQIHKIERVQNPRMWNDYAFRRQNLHNELSSMPNVQVEMDLFHGTKDAPPSEIYLGEYGFDMTFSSEHGMWGRGTYFAQNASYSCNFYAYSLPDGKRQVFLAQVLTGHVYNCEPDKTLRRPPKKNENIDGRRYNSVSGETRGTKVYIIYENRIAYPTYLITFS